MTKLLILGASCALLLASAASSHAGAVTVQNSSFEVRDNPGDQYGSASFWLGSSFTELSADVSITGGDGPRHNGQNPGDTANQDLGVTFLANYIYTLTIAIGNRTTDSNNPTGTARFGLTSDNGLTELGIFTTAVSPPNTFQDFTYTFVTGAVAPAGNVGIRLGATGGRGLFDNVRLDASVPEPSSLGLLGLTTLGIGAIRRRRR